MTIHQLLNSRFGRYSSIGALSEGGDFFVANSNEFLAIDDGDLFIAIDRTSKRFALQRGDFTLRGETDTPLTPEQLAILSPKESLISSSS